jgi:hypothetical protein
MRRAACLIALSLLVAGCSVRADMHDAAMATGHFHALLNDGKFDQIVAEAPNLSWPSHGPTFKDYLAAVHRKLGFCGQSRILNFHENFGINGRTVIEARTHCDGDDAIESFVFAGRGAGLRLQRYQITSPVLVTS